MKKVLIANRGEIACRIMRSAKQLGLCTVAVFSEADRHAKHVAMADEAVFIGESPASKSYLDHAAVLSAARSSGANAIHPGYGFLSESAAFADAVLKAGLIWVGPTPDTIRLMGDKETARATAARAGVPVMAGSRRFKPGDLGDLDSAARATGFPLLVKAAAGGGGIGMKQADGPEKLEALVIAVQEAAQKSFGNGDVYLERYLPKARHVEVQVFGWGDGTATHFFERDCSLQRRFQKVIEEAPAPGLPASVRQAMYDATLALCRATSYAGAGTVEFIVDAESFDFFFLEMNTRIQVEHVATEMITGVDLVAMQLRLAAGAASLDIQEAAPVAHGSAIECRLYAENPAKMFFPSPGRLDTFDLPGETDRIRIETGYRQGDTVTPFYDPMIAKIVVYGESREQAVSLALSVLETVRVEGIVTNNTFLQACLRNKSFRQGDVHTRFIDENKPELLARMHDIALVD